MLMYQISKKWFEVVKALNDDLMQKFFGGGSRVGLGKNPKTGKLWGGAAALSARKVLATSIIE